MSGEVAGDAQTAAKALADAAATDSWKVALRAVRRRRRDGLARSSSHLDRELNSLLERLQHLLAGPSLDLDHDHRDALVDRYTRRIEYMLTESMKPDDLRLITAILERAGQVDDDQPTVFTVVPSAEPGKVLQVDARAGASRHSGPHDRQLAVRRTGNTPVRAGYVYKLLTETAIGRQWPVLAGPARRISSGNLRESVALQRIVAPTQDKESRDVYWRQEILERLYTLTDQPDGKLHVLSGVPGAGRTTVAAAVAARAQARGTVVWWVPCGAGYTYTGMAAIAALLGAGTRALADAVAGRRSLPDLVWDMLEKAGKPWLLIMDDLEDADAPAGSSPFAWARPSQRGLVLITTRAGREPKNEHRIQHHVLQAVPPAAAAKTLLGLSPHAGSLAEAEELSSSLGGLPLSLSLSSACLNYSRSPFRTFRAYLDRIRPGLSDTSAGPALVTLDSLIGSLLDTLHGVGVPQARPILSILSHFAAGVPLPGIIFTSLRLAEYGVIPFADETRLRADISHGIEALEQLGMLRRTDAISTAAGELELQMIPAIAQTCRRQFGESPPSMNRAVRAAAAASLDAAVCKYVESEEKDWASTVYILPHVFSLLENISQGSPDVALEKAVSAACTMADYLIETGAYHDGENLARKAHALGAGLRNDEHPLVMEASVCLASALMARRQFGKAEELIRDVLSVRQRIQGNSHPETLRVLGKLASCLREQGRLRDAELTFRLVFSGRQRLLGGNNADSLETLESLAEVLWAQGDVGQAERSLRRVVDGRSRVLEPNAAATVSALIDLAAIQRNAGRLSESEAALLEVIRVRQQDHGDEDPQTLTARTELAATWRRQGRLDDAEKVLNRVLNVLRELLGPEDPETLAIVVDLAEVARERGGPRDAYELLRPAYDGQLACLPSAHPDLLSTGISLGIFLRDFGNWDEAEEVLRSVIASYRNVAGEDHPATLCAEHNLAAVLLDMGRFDEAETICKHVLDSREWTLGPNHPDTLDALANMACLLRSKGALRGARDAFSQALAGCEDLLGSEHPTTVTIRANLAGVLWEQGQAAEALEMCRAVIASRELSLGPEHLETLLGRVNLATILASTGLRDEAAVILEGVLPALAPSPPAQLVRAAALYALAAVFRQSRKLDEAQDALRQVVTIRSDYFGSDHPETLTARNELARVLREMGRGGEADREYADLLNAAERYVLEGCE